MLLQRAGDGGDFAPFDAGRAPDPIGANGLPALTSATIREARSLRGSFGAEAETEVDRRIAFAMEGCRLDEAHRLWAIWLALRNGD